MSRRGTTLHELLLAVSCTGLLAAAVSPLLLTASRAVRRAQRQLAVERDMLALGALLAAALRPSAVADVAAPSGRALEFDRQVGSAVACGGGPAGVLVPRDGWVGSRAPEPGRDQLLALAADSLRWGRAGVVSFAGATCPGGADAWLLGLDPPMAPPLRVRVVEPVRIRAYPSGGGWWLGLERRGSAAAIQPFAGPVAPDGLSIRRDSARAELRLEVRWGAGGGELLLVHGLDPGS
jgi:type II secretory pathway pseudopilin PulG